MNHHVKPMTLIKETDYGTPHPEVTETTKLVTLQIDGLEITVPEGTSIMNAAMQLGIQVPRLCATDNLEAFGSCRLCLCEIEGRKGTPASCTTPVAPGLKVTTQNARLAGVTPTEISTRLRNLPFNFRDQVSKHFRHSIDLIFMQADF